MRYVHLFLSLIFLLTASGEFLRPAAWRPVHPVWREPLESSSIFESLVIVAQLTLSLPLHLPAGADLPSSVGQPFSAAHFF